MHWGLVGLISVVFAGCLAKMENVTEETRDYVKSTNDKLDEAKLAQSCLEALKLLRDPSPNIRSGAATTILVDCPLGKLPSVLGLPSRRLQASSVPRVIHKGETRSEVQVPNVTIIRNRREGETAQPSFDYDLIVAPLDADIFETLEFTAYALVRTVADAVDTPGISDEDQTRLAKLSERLFLVLPALIGASEILELKEALREEHPDRPYVVNKERRKETATLLGKIARALHFSQNVVEELRFLSEAKLGFPSL